MRPTRQYLIVVTGAAIMLVAGIITYARYSVDQFNKELSTYPDISDYRRMPAVSPAVPKWNSIDDMASVFPPSGNDFSENRAEAINTLLGDKEAKFMQSAEMKKVAEQIETEVIPKYQSMLDNYYEIRDALMTEHDKGKDYRKSDAYKAAQKEIESNPEYQRLMQGN